MTRPSLAPIDRHIGKRLRQKRAVKGLSQSQLATLIGTAFQQIHKYEQGINRISASRLYVIARAFGVPVAYPYEGWAEPSGSGSAKDTQVNDRETLELVRMYRAISDSKMRRKVYELISSMVNFD